tara:strand:- start:437 stop:868 length:432 start_codon:yes stop_codon:yes gene_type:complete
MKTRILSIALMASAAFIIGCGQTTTQEPTLGTISVEEMKTPATLAVKIEGMSCPSGCAAKIQEACSGLKGVGKSEVNFDESTGYFTFDASLISEEDILKCISGTNGGGIYTGTVVEEDVEVETEEATTEEALHVEKNEDEAHV